MRGVVYPVTSFRINNNANAVKNWRNALNQEDTGTLHAAPMSGGGVTPLVVGCRGGAIVWILILIAGEWWCDNYCDGSDV